MKKSSRSRCLVALVAIAAVACGGLARAALTPEEAAQLGGKTLTEFGAERAGNADGSIPEYTGGNRKAPAGFDPKVGSRPDPYAGEKPLFSINAANMDKYAAKLTEGTKALMKQFPDWRIDVYKTHRSAYYPQWALDNTKKVATKARTSKDGNSLLDAHAAIPFPIPKNGNEVMWNHELRFQGLSVDMFGFGSYVVDRSGRPTQTALTTMNWDYPYWDESYPSKEMDYQFLMFASFLEPRRKTGELMLMHETLNLEQSPRKVWQYLPGQRRVKLAPEVAFDTPNTGEAGFNTYDDDQIFNGSMERFDWKLVGKKEMYVPYNCYRAVYGEKLEDLKPHFVDPSTVRFELHRVWVVEATLKPGKRHIYHRRTYYVDEDSWAGLAADNYDSAGKFYHVNLGFLAPYYDFGGVYLGARMSINLSAGGYLVTYVGPGFRVVETKKRRVSFYSADRMSAEGVR